MLRHHPQWNLLARAFALSLLLCSGTASASFVPLGPRTPDPAVPSQSGARRALDCTGVEVLQIGDAVNGSTLGLTSEVDVYGCSSWVETGGEVVYALNVPEPELFEIRLLADCDLDLVLLSSCDAATGCLLVADSGIRTTTPTAGDWFVVVDGYQGAACDFTLEIAPIGPGSVDAAACENATSLSCENSVVLSGDTCSGEDHVRQLGCETFPAAGADDWYRLTLAPGGEVSAEVTMAGGDAALWILGGCGEAAECLGYADDWGTGEAESVSWVNDGAEHRTVFLVVDSYEPASCGAYEGSVVCEGFIVPTEATTWSALKGRFSGEEE